MLDYFLLFQMKRVTLVTRSHYRSYLTYGTVVMSSYLSYAAVKRKNKLIILRIQ